MGRRFLGPTDKSHSYTRVLDRSEWSSGQSGDVTLNESEAEVTVAADAGYGGDLTRVYVWSVEEDGHPKIAQF